ncbi:MFS transporter [Alkalicella caledoniensis]|uniref:MFS transporter n=1 Tax=Alkalicella caledoniensis TaxID=2731377 RepID=A0A7G9W8S5_ALKCA|nr:MFS transporter [Alkalicella caledoniensis]QNO15087.1 MFS transporter [Alkalicella caledoniensis]
MNYRKNINIYSYYRMFGELIILGPIIMVFLREKGLSFSEIMLISSIGSISVFIFEVPTGILADKISRKYSLVLGSLLWTLQLIIMIFANSFLAFAVAEIFLALGITLKSGAKTALLYDSLKTINRENEIQKYEGKANPLIFYSQAIGSIAAGFLYTINIYLPFVISAVNTVIAAIIALRFSEPPIEDKKDKDSYFKFVKESGKYVMNHSKVKAVILYGTIFYMFYRAGFFFFQPYFEGVNINIKYFGLLFALFNIVAGIVAQNAHTIMSKAKRRTLTLLSGLMILSFFTMTITKVWIGAFAILLQQAARGLYPSIISKYMNKHIPSNRRATIMSLYSLVVNVSAALLYPVLGIIMDRSGVFAIHGIMTVAMLVLTAITLTYYGRVNNSLLNSEKVA